MRLIAPRPSDSQEDYVADQPSRPIPGEVLDTCCRRVRAAALVIGGLWLFVLAMNNIVVEAFGGMDPHYDVIWPWPGNLVAIAGAALSFITALLPSRLRVGAQRYIDVGLLFMVTTAFLAALVMQWHPHFPTLGVSWVAVLILIYPAIAPSTAGKTLAAGLAAASMEPIVAGVGVLRELPIQGNGFNAIWYLTPSYICAFIAVLPATIIRGLGRQVGKARELGSYRLEESIGHGGMGEVYRATHRLLARPAAVKLIRPEVLGSAGDQRDVWIQRFRREAEAAATLGSVHTIKLYDFGLADDGTFFYVMELLEGLDFEKLVLEHGPQPPERVAHLIAQACESLAEAHARGLVHRDVKPSNIHVGCVGLTADFVKVLDFGLVKGSPHRAPVNARLTLPDMVMGTPAYLAPEVASGELVDYRADVYALGCVTYWLLTGRLVFEAPTAMHMVARHIQMDPERPSSRAPTTLPPELDEIVLACLAKDPSARPQDAMEVARRLNACRFPEPWTQDRARAWWIARGESRGLPGPAFSPVTASVSEPIASV